MIDTKIEYTTSDELWGVKPLEFNRYFESYSRRRSKPSGYLNVDSNFWDRDINEHGAIKLLNVKPGNVLWLNTTTIVDEGPLISTSLSLWDMMKKSMQTRLF